jgi:hypothetical protein
MRRHRGSEVDERAKDPDRVIGRGPDEQLDVAGAARETMGGQRIGPHDDEGNLMIAKARDEIDEVLVDLVRAHGEARRIRPGDSLRS